MSLPWRVLQDEPSSNTPDSQNTDAFEFIAFVLWYIFLVLCCVVPTCCAYRRRRLMESRMQEQQVEMSRLRQSNMYIISNLNSRRNGEQVQAERRRIFSEELGPFSMTVQSSDLSNKTRETDASWQRGRVQSLHESGVHVTPGSADAIAEGRMYDDDADFSSLLQLPGVPSRQVPGFCAICLCAYEEGDRVSWSSQSECQHGFHTDCILSWLIKKEEPKCPVCRQSFCATPRLDSTSDTSADVHTTLGGLRWNYTGMFASLNPDYQSYTSTRQENRDSMTLEELLQHVEAEARNSAGQEEGIVSEDLLPTTEEGDIVVSGDVESGNANLRDDDPSSTWST